MYQLPTKYAYCFGLVCLLSMGLPVMAQKAERNYLRKGNRYALDSLFVEAEVNYRKALEVNPSSSMAYYNLGYTLTAQQKFPEAMKQYETAERLEENKLRHSQINHNQGVIWHLGKKYKEAIEAYKKSLRKNPHDDETRYNLALAQKMLKDQQGQQNNPDKQKNNNSSSLSDYIQQEAPQKEEQLSKERIEQLLNAQIEKEKDVQKRVQQQRQQPSGNRNPKNW